MDEVSELSAEVVLIGIVLADLEDLVEIILEGAIEVGGELRDGEGILEGDGIDLLIGGIVVPIALVRRRKPFVLEQGEDEVPGLVGIRSLLVDLLLDFAKRLLVFLQGKLAEQFRREDLVIQMEGDPREEKDVHVEDEVGLLPLVEKAFDVAGIGSHVRKLLIGDQAFVAADLIEVPMLEIGDLISLPQGELHRLGRLYGIGLFLIDIAFRLDDLHQDRKGIAEIDLGQSIVVDKLVQSFHTRCLFLREREELLLKEAIHPLLHLDVGKQRIAIGIGDVHPEEGGEEIQKISILGIMDQDFVFLLVSLPLCFFAILFDRRKFFSSQVGEEIGKLMNLVRKEKDRNVFGLVPLQPEVRKMKERVGYLVFPENEKKGFVLVFFQNQVLIAME